MGQPTGRPPAPAIASKARLDEGDRPPTAAAGIADLLRPFAVKVWDVEEDRRPAEAETFARTVATWHGLDAALRRAWDARWIVAMATAPHPGPTMAGRLAAMAAAPGGPRVEFRDGGRYARAAFVEGTIGIDLDDASFAGGAEDGLVSVLRIADDDGAAGAPASHAAATGRACLVGPQAGIAVVGGAAAWNRAAAALVDLAQACGVEGVRGYTMYAAHDREGPHWCRIAEEWAEWPIAGAEHDVLDHAAAVLLPIEAGGDAETEGLDAEAPASATLMAARGGAGRAARRLAEWLEATGAHARLVSRWRA